jgi:predicted glycosyltransferase
VSWGDALTAECRALRVLLVANDGLSAGHVARAVAISRGLARRAVARGIAVKKLLATTSEAHALLADEELAVVRLPTPVAARRAGLSDLERRRVVRGALGGVVDAFVPDLIVADTFPSGPHGELGGIGAADERRAKRVLVRRNVPDERDDDDALTAGLLDYDLAVVADDPLPCPVRLPISVVRVPPITITEVHDGKTRAFARAELGLPVHGRVVLVAAGGGGDDGALSRASALALTITEIAPEVTVALALGPLARRSEVPPRVRRIDAVPLGPFLTAFDGAFAPAGYNTAHELAKARVPAALFAQPRPFDDQAARAARFAQASLARTHTEGKDAIAKTLEWMTSASVGPIEGGGADRAGDALLDLVTGRGPTSSDARPEARIRTRGRS